jgi:hypothetical protein
MSNGEVTVHTGADVDVLTSSKIGALNFTGDGTGITLTFC